MFGLGPAELLVILAILLFFFGATRIPKLAKALGMSIREFRDGIEKPPASLPEESSSTKPEPTLPMKTS